jgi:hypothetical protein
MDNHIEACAHLKQQVLPPAPKLHKRAPLKGLAELFGACILQGSGIENFHTANGPVEHIWF